MKQFLPYHPQSNKSDSKEFGPRPAESFMSERKREIHFGADLLRTKLTRQPRGIVSLADRAESTPQQPQAEAAPLVPTAQELAEQVTFSKTLSPEEENVIATARGLINQDALKLGSNPSQAEEDAIARAHALLDQIEWGQ